MVEPCQWLNWEDGGTLPAGPATLHIACMRYLLSLDLSSCLVNVVMAYQRFSLRPLKLTHRTADG